MSQIQASFRDLVTEHPIQQHAEANLLTHPDCYCFEPVPGSGRRLAIIPRAEFSFDQFVARTPQRSVAFDGIVTGGTRLDLSSRHFVIDHHDHCQRDITLASAQQMRLLRQQGLMNLLTVNDRYDFIAWKNDVDCDATSTSFQLIYSELCDGPLFNRLLDGYIGPLDVSAGGRGPKLSTDLMRQGTWIFEPYFRDLHRIYSMNGKQLADLTLEMYDRLRKYLLGQGSMGEIDTRTTELRRGSGWLMLQEHGAHSRLAAFQNNPHLQGLVVFKGQDKGEYRYSAVRQNQLSFFPVTLLADVFNRAELFAEQHSVDAFQSLLKDSSHDRAGLWETLSSLAFPEGWIKPWGGGDGVIGCLRTKASCIALEPMGTFVEYFMIDLAHQAYQANCFTLRAPLVKLAKES